MRLSQLTNLWFVTICQMWFIVQKKTNSMRSLKTLNIVLLQDSHITGWYGFIEKSELLSNAPKAKIKYKSVYSQREIPREKEAEIVAL
ncbi:hypothetical protein OH492_23260 [Vibrio chagasii]|nr:hypothetical protein [Vibrio chagasii]